MDEDGATSSAFVFTACLLISRFLLNSLKLEVNPEKNLFDLDSEYLKALQSDRVDVPKRLSVSGFCRAVVKSN